MKLAPTITTPRSPASVARRNIMVMVEVATATPATALVTVPAAASTVCKMPLRSWEFVINNYTQADTDAILALDLNRIKRLVVAREVGKKCGTPHYQGYISLYKSARQRQVCAWLGGRASVFPAPYEPGAVKYAMKDGDIWINHGTSPKPTPRPAEGKDAAAHVIEMIDQGATIKQIWAAHRVFYMYNSDKIIREYKRAKYYHEHPDEDGFAPCEYERYS